MYWHWQMVANRFWCTARPVADRTGFVAAAYRITKQGWNAEDAINEMRKYWHEPEGKPLLGVTLRAMPAAENMK